MTYDHRRTNGTVTALSPNYAKATNMVNKNCEIAIRSLNIILSYLCLSYIIALFS